KADPYNLDQIAAPQHCAGINPKEIVDNASKDGITEYIGKCPVKVESYDDTQQLHLKKYEDYQSVDTPSDGLSGEKEVKIDDLYIDIVTDETIRVSGLQTGEYDIAARLPYDNAEELESDDNIKTFAEPFEFKERWFNKKDGP